MGNDGGSIPTRRELVKEAARNPTTSQIKETQHEKQEYFWTTDPISQKPLVQPIVSDAYGTLYNKDTILEYLLEGARSEDVKRTSRDCVKSLKDVVEVKFATDESGKAWTCPVTGDKLGPGSKAVYLVPCGHAFSGIAMKEVSGDKCTVCETDYAPNDVIPIISAVETDIARLTLRLQTLQEKGLSHSLKKASGSKKRKKTDVVADPVETAKAAEKNSSINNSSTASLTAKVLQEQDSSKKRKTNSDTVKSLFSNKDQTSNNRNNDFMTRGFSVPVKR
ncbi:hypothetical protein AMS68_000636 [Peltaster fructicola]|uniref:Uncharacterized protein n=1 Tax=Peltaster fructicola TaxID=286661 RepID=A0A6H0XKF9_9PEZI|nr:hypothetical protein AMS68_000636 [Peltaster fructicola]